MQVPWGAVWWYWQTMRQFECYKKKHGFVQFRGKAKFIPNPPLSLGLCSLFSNIKLSLGPYSGRTNVIRPAMWHWSIVLTVISFDPGHTSSIKIWVFHLNSVRIIVLVSHYHVHVKIHTTYLGISVPEDIKLFSKISCSLQKKASLQKQLGYLT